MPTYEFRCPDGTIIERVFKMSEVPQTIPAPDGSGDAVRIISGGADLIFKGSGFYITDYGKDGKKDERSRKEESTAGQSDSSKTAESATSAKAETTDKPAKADKPDSASKSEKSESKSESKSEKTDKSDKSDKKDKAPPPSGAAA